MQDGNCKISRKDTNYYKTKIRITKGKEKDEFVRNYILYYNYCNIY